MNRTAAQEKGYQGLLPKTENIGGLHVAVGFMPAFKHN